MDYTAGIFFESERLKPEEVFFFWNIHIYEAETVAVRFKHVGVWCLTNLALKLFPHVGDLVRLLLDCHFLLQPKLEAFVVDKAHRSVAFA